MTHKVLIDEGFFVFPFALTFRVAGSVLTRSLEVWRRCVGGFLSACLILGLTLGGVARAQDEDNIVSVYNWADYIDQTILADFTEETGIEVVYDVFDSNDVVEAKLRAGTANYDLIVPSLNFAARHLQVGLIQPLDKSQLPNLVNLSSKMMALVATQDPGNHFTVPYLWGTTGLGYNLNAVQKILGKEAPLNTLSNIFDPDIVKRLSRCGVQILDAADEVLPAMLSYLGRDPLSNNEDDLSAAVDALRQVTPYIDRFNSGDFASGLISGETCMVFGWSGDVLYAKERAIEDRIEVDIGYAIPREGGQVFFDVFVIPKNAKHVRAAHTFINYMLRPEVIARVTNKIAYPNPNEASRDLIRPEFLSDPMIYPDINQSPVYLPDVKSDEASRRINRHWLRAKTGL